MPTKNSFTALGVSRRAFMHSMGLLGAGGLLAAYGGHGSRALASTDVNLDFAVWTYAVDEVESNIRAWEAANPGMTVTLQDYPWDHYKATMVQRLATNTPTDVLYNNSSWLAEFVGADWVVPISKYLDFEKYRDKIIPYALSGMTYNGEPYGLPYYADIASFIWNPTVAKEYGVDRAPTSWDEVMEMSVSMQGKGLRRPILWEFSQINPSSLDEFIAMSMSRGGEVFDADLNPIFEDPDSPAFQQAQFMADTIEQGLAATSPTENDAVRAMNSGQHVFTCMYNYNLAAMNNTGQPLAGQFKLAMMPGSTRATLGYVRFYSITSMAEARGDAVTAAAGNFIESMGGAPDGTFTIPKKWAINRGLGFGVLPLFDDPEVIDAFSTWVDVETLKEQQKLAQTKNEAKWTGIWGDFMLRELSKIFAGETTVAESMKASADKARELKERYQ
ncbi:ABC transporter substrate-binding protein [Ferruginivarius sediminum]|uniref:Extracellular solute-binding protein n=1 Tax=Ferruginivarius sediminum TaxID=2661937 RepID=A0A369T8D6_9PROT|nr:extracellular solute-binding protein [Ferruginivarius sediminum]RDD60615.1 extracellular solute-binding protein [Ferruginivarius sediminum]